MVPRIPEYSEGNQEMWRSSLIMQIKGIGLSYILVKRDSSRTIWDWTNFEYLHIVSTKTQSLPFTIVGIYRNCGFSQETFTPTWWTGCMSRTVLRNKTMQVR